MSLLKMFKKKKVDVPVVEEFHFRDTVKVKSGFYKGIVGTVESKSNDRYLLDAGENGFKWIDSSDLERLSQE